MARPTEPPPGTQRRLELDLGRYWRTYRFVRDRVAQGKSKHAAYLAAVAQLEVPYDTAKKHYLRMHRSIEAAKAAGINTTVLVRPTIEDDLRFIDHAHIDREQQQEDIWAQDVSQHLYEYAFTPEERRQLRRVPVALRRQLAQERIELMELKRNRK
jgi:hypothetical protein